jgi:hypothetical protein
VREVNELMYECDGLGASSSKIIKTILTGFVQSETNHVNRCEKPQSEVKRRFLTDSARCALSTRID